MAGFPEPQAGVLYLTEGGQETELMYKHGHELPEFAMYLLVGLSPTKGARGGEGDAGEAALGGREPPVPDPEPNLILYLPMQRPVLAANDEMELDAGPVDEHRSGLINVPAARQPATDGCASRRHGGDHRRHVVCPVPPCGLRCRRCRE